MKGKNQLTRDGVHMNPFGDQMMAVGVLKGLGMTESQVQKARDFWISMPEVACTVTGKTGLTLRQYKQLSDLAAKENRSIKDLVNAGFAKSMESLVPAVSGEKSKYVSRIMRALLWVRGLGPFPGRDSRARPSFRQPSPSRRDWQKIHR